LSGEWTLQEGENHTDVTSWLFLKNQLKLDQSGTEFNSFWKREKPEPDPKIWLEKPLA
jgi:hypothetical protein